MDAAPLDDLDKDVPRMAKTAKTSGLSGFPEWLPAERLVEQHVIDVFREVAELHGFSGIETRSVEPLEQLLRKGEIDKERSEEHTSELQSRGHLVCRLLLEKK